MLCWLCCWGWWQLASVSSQWWCVERSFWVGDRDLYLAGNVLWFWGWRCLAFSSWRFLKMLLHRSFQVLLSALGAFLPHCCQIITRLPEWSSGLLGPMASSHTWAELNGVAPATCKEWGSLHPGRANSGCFQCILLNGNQLWRSPGSTGIKEAWLVLTFKVWPCCTAGACAASSCKTVSMKALGYE